MRITNSTFYFLTITALAALIIIGLYFFSRKHDCYGDCHVHGNQAIEQVTEQVVETPAEQIAAEVTQAPEEALLPETAATQNIK